jgi:predicted HTH transcriptional regulator
MTPYSPPFQLNNTMLTKVAEIAELLGQWKQANREGLLPQLRRGNRIRTIQASLAIEHNSLSIEQVTAVLDGKPVLNSTAQKNTQENTQEKIFLLLKQEPTITRNELAKRLNLTPDSVKHHLQKLKQAGRIEHVGPTKSGHWRTLK